MSKVEIEVTLKIDTDKIHVELSKEEARALRDALDKALKTESAYAELKPTPAISNPSTLTPPFGNRDLKPKYKPYNPFDVDRFGPSATLARHKLVC